MYNVLFSLLPPLVIGIFDQFVSARILDRYPQLYILGQKNAFFTKTAFWMWVGNALYHSFVSHSSVFGKQVLISTLGPVSVLNHPVLGRLEAGYGFGFGALVLGADALPRCAAYGAWEGCVNIRVGRFVTTTPLR